MTNVFTLPVDVWHVIIKYLDPKAALNLRQTCRQYNEMITDHQTYWYRQFTWFLITQNKRVALFKTGCKRKHKPNVLRGMNCLNSAQEKDLCHKLDIRIQRLPAIVQQNPDVMVDYECTNPTHYVYQVPQNQFSIPIDRKDYHPTEQIYMYRFLIHNYRHERDKARRIGSSDTLKDDIKKTMRTIKSTELRIQTLQRRLEVLEDSRKLVHKVEHNKVFFGVKSRQYKPQ